MKKNIIKSFLFLITSCIFLHSCDYPNEYQPKGDYISGNAVFIDTNFIRSGGQYKIALYKNRPNPFDTLPVKAEIIDTGYVCINYFRIYWERQDNLFVAVIWARSEDINKNPIVLGTFGCDTTHHCTESKLIAFPNFTGADYGFLCWADTSKKLN
jgi:hypothetical protein